MSHHKDCTFLKKDRSIPVSTYMYIDLVRKTSAIYLHLRVLSKPALDRHAVIVSRVSTSVYIRIKDSFIIFTDVSFIPTWTGIHCEINESCHGEINWWK